MRAAVLHFAVARLPACSGKDSEGDHDGPDQWTMEPQDALLYYTQLEGIGDSVKSAILAQFVTNVTNNANQLPRITGNEAPYRAPLTAYTWSSNQIKMAQARLYELLAECGTEAAAEAASVGAEG